MKTVIEQQKKSRLKNNDKISRTNDTITINGVCFSFEKGKDIVFAPPSGQIHYPHRDEKGNLVATIVQYVVDFNNVTECEQEIVKTIEASIEEPAEEEELAQVEQDIEEIIQAEEKRILREQAIKNLTGENNG